MKVKFLCQQQRTRVQFTLGKCLIMFERDLNDELDQRDIQQQFLKEQKYNYWSLPLHVKCVRLGFQPFGEGDGK